MSVSEQISKRIELISHCANQETKELFRENWVSVIDCVKEWFGPLPLGPTQFKEEGGAYRATIEATFYSMRFASGFKFGATLTSDLRRKLEPQYNYAVFLAAVTSLLDEPYRFFSTSRLSDGSTWEPAAHGPLVEWLRGSEFKLSVRENPLPVERMRTASLAHIVIRRNLLQSLHSDVVADLFGAINPSKTPQGVESLVHAAVRKGVAAALDFDLREQRGSFDIQAKVPPNAQKLTTAFDDLYQERQVQPVVAKAAEPAKDDTKSAQAASQPSLVLAKSNTDSKQLQLDGISAANTADVNPPPLVLTPSNGPLSDAEIQALLAKVLGTCPRALQQLFQDLYSQAKSGKIKIEFEGDNICVPKKVYSSYGLVADTLIQGLKKGGLFVRAGSNEVVASSALARIFKDIGSRA